MLFMREEKDKFNTGAPVSNHVVSFFGIDTDNTADHGPNV